MLAAEILLCPNNKFIYVSNRNDPSPEGDSIAVFNVPTGSDECKLVREIRSGVKHARGMSFSRDGKYLAVAGNHSGSVKIFEVVEGSADGDVGLVASIEGLEKPTVVLWL
jgi:6-phosphogluconolactonase (cycloisomerase 2 family)